MRSGATPRTYPQDSSGPPIADMSARPRQLGWPCSQVSSIGRQGDQDQLQTRIGKRGLTTFSKQGETPTVSRNASGKPWGLRGPKYLLKASAVQEMNRCSRAGGRVEQSLTTNYLRNISKLRQASPRRGQACVQPGAVECRSQRPRVHRSPYGITIYHPPSYEICGRRRGNVESVNGLHSGSQVQGAPNIADRVSHHRIRQS